MKRTALMMLSLLLVACDEENTTARDRQVAEAATAANSVAFSANAEIDNIKRRLELTSDPGLLGFIVLLNEAGQPILYTTVMGKVTSSGKRLTPPDQSVTNDWCDNCVRAAPSDEGTWGASSPYVYFWDTRGVYHQWSGQYLYSDQPIRMRVEPLVIAIGEEAAAVVRP